MTIAARYVKIVERSDEDGAFVGQCPGVIGPCCHGADEVEVYRQLCAIVSESLELAEQDGTLLVPPAPASPRRSSNSSSLRIRPADKLRGKLSGIIFLSL